MYKFNLGRLNHCVEYLAEGTIAKCSIPDTKLEVLCYPRQGSEAIKVDGDVIGGSISVPLFDIKCACDNGKISEDDPKTIDKLMTSMELEILSMVRQILKQGYSQYSICLSNLKILVRSIQLFEDKKMGGCYGRTEVGIALILGDSIN